MHGTDVVHVTGRQGQGRGEHRPEPGTVIPATGGVGAVDGVGVLVGFIHVGEPQVTIGAPALLGVASSVRIPLGIFDLDVLGNEGFGFVDQRNFIHAGQCAGDIDHGAADGLDRCTAGRLQSGFGCVVNHEGRDNAGIDVDAGGCVAVVVVPLHARALVVRVVIGLCAGAVVGHIGHVLRGFSAQVRGAGFARWRDPGVGLAVRDPGRVAAVQVNHGTVLGIQFGGQGRQRIGRAQGAQASARHGHIGGDKDVAAAGVGQRVKAARGQVVVELQAYRNTGLAVDDGAQVMWLVAHAKNDLAMVVQHRGAVEVEELVFGCAGRQVGGPDLHIAAQRGAAGDGIAGFDHGRQVGVQLFTVLDHGDFIVVGIRKAHGMRRRQGHFLDGRGNVLAQQAGIGGQQGRVHGVTVDHGQVVDKLAQCGAGVARGAGSSIGAVVDLYALRAVGKKGALLEGVAGLVGVVGPAGTGQRCRCKRGARKQQSQGDAGIGHRPKCRLLESTTWLIKFHINPGYVTEKTEATWSGFLGSTVRFAGFI